MLSALNKRLPVREGRVPWDVRWVPPNSENSEVRGLRSNGEGRRSAGGPELHDEHWTKSVRGLRPEGQPIPTGVVGGQNLEYQW